jgi:hypothetical protein
MRSCEFIKEGADLDYNDPDLKKARELQKAKEQKKTPAKKDSKKTVKEDATAGATSSPTVAVSFKQQGKLPTEMIKRQKGYTNQLSKGGAVNIKKSK